MRTLESSLNHIFPLSIHLHTVTSSDFEKLAPWGEYSNHSAYFRLKLGDFVDSSVDKCLYLDTDIIAMEDIRGIFEIDLGEHIAAVVKNTIAYDEERLAHFLMPKSKKASYFNSGVMLINTKKFKALNFSSIHSFPRDGCTDQDFLNHLFGESIRLLDFRWNLQWIDERFLRFSGDDRNAAFSYEEFISALKSPKLVHFVIYKPWHKYMLHPYSYVEPHTFITHPYAKEWFSIARQTPFYSDIIKQYYKKAVRFALGFYLKLYTPRLWGILKRLKSCSSMIFR